MAKFVAEMQNTIKEIPELTYLLQEVERHYGRSINTTTDFEALSIVIERETGDLISASTLKRMWGYVSLKPKPRVSTLDILARFIGKKDFKTFCKDLKNTSYFESNFFSAETVSAKDMNVGDRLLIGWNPDRIVVLEYQGDYSFVVVESVNSQLQEGDVFSTVSFILGYPMYVTGILRGGEMTDPYIAGAKSGLTKLELQKRQ